MKAMVPHAVKGYVVTQLVGNGGIIMRRYTKIEVVLEYICVNAKNGWKIPVGQTGTRSSFSGACFRGHNIFWFCLTFFSVYFKRYIGI